jgi:hypothetical protein
LPKPLPPLAIACTTTLVAPAGAVKLPVPDVVTVLTTEVKSADFAIPLSLKAPIGIIQIL